MSFEAAVRDIENVLKTDTALDDYMQAEFSRSLTFMYGNCKRTEFPKERMPAVLVVYGDDGEPENQPDMTDLDTVELLLIVAFEDEKKERAFFRTRKLVEGIKAALYKDITRGENASNTTIRRTFGDLGANHPVQYRFIPVELQFFSKYN